MACALGIVSRLLHRWLVARPRGQSGRTKRTGSQQHDRPPGRLHDAIGPMDDAYFLYFEGDRLLSAGTARLAQPGLWYAPSSRVMHLAEPGDGRDQGDRRSSTQKR